MFYCLCYVKEISTDVLEEQVSEERYLDMKEEEGIIMEYSREYHCRNVFEGGEDKSNIHYLRLYVYTIEKLELIKWYFWCPFRIQNSGKLFGLV